MGSLLERLSAEEEALQTERMLRACRLYQKVFISKLTVLAAGGLLLGFYFTNAVLIFRRELEREVVIPTACPHCALNDFELVCSQCRAILGCSDCFKVRGQECGCEGPCLRVYLS